MLEAAVSYGHLHVIKWLAEEKVCDSIPLEVLESASSLGHFEIVVWAYEKGSELPVDLVHYALRNGREDIFFWALERGCQIINDDNSHSLYQVILDKRFHIATLSLEQQCALPDPFVNSCIVKGDREIIDFVLQTRPDFSNFYTHLFVQEELKDTLDYLHQKGHTLWEQCFRDACDQGNLAMMEHILPHITTRDPLWCRFAKDLRTFQWMDKKGFLPWPEELLYEFVSKKNKVEIVEYMLSNGCPYDMERLRLCCSRQNAQMKVVIDKFLSK